MSLEMIRLGDVAEINPRRLQIDLTDADMVTFVPMEAVDETTGAITASRIRPFGEVKKGYTAFTDGDVIFAKVTPCMQNGKHAIADNLLNGLGFGSTEFHVVRPGPRILSEWVYYFLRRQETLDAAKKTINGAVGLQRVPPSFLEEVELLLPDIDAQRCITESLKGQLAVIEEARQAAKVQIAELPNLAHSIIRESLNHPDTEMHLLGDVLDEVKRGVGASWADYPVLGATRSGLAPAREPVGKTPERYKPVFTGTVFYNPMRILIGSIAMVDEHDAPGITSPDYVVLRGRAGLVDSRWFYYWLRSSEGERCIASLARGAVRERMLFNRLAEGEISLPPYAVQVAASQALADIRPLKTHVEAQLRDIELLPSRLLSEVFGSIPAAQDDDE